MKNPADGIKDAMWHFLMSGSQKFDNEDIKEMEEAVYRLIQMTTQKNAGQAKYATATQINWDTLDMEFMRIVCFATSLVLSGRLEELKNGYEEVGL